MNAPERFAGTAEAAKPPARFQPAGDPDQAFLSQQLRLLSRVATVVAFLTTPVLYIWFHEQIGWGVGWSVFMAFVSAAAFRGFVDIVVRRFIPWPNLFGQEDDRLKEEDVVNRRRAWFWSWWFRLLRLMLIVFTAAWLVWGLVAGFDEASWTGTFAAVWDGITFFFASGIWVQLLILPFFFVGNFLIFFGPMVLMGISQIRSYEPGDADWGVRLDDVRGQPEAKEEVRRVVNLWQSGETFERAGGKRERGMLLLGAPGTGKTMLSKAIATSFNAPFVSVPGSGFAQAFIGIDVIVVRYLARKAKRLARKWGGQCIVFIDEIDAVGRRRAALQGGQTATPLDVTTIHDYCFFGPWGSLTSSGDLVVESREWRERLFTAREPLPSPTAAGRVYGLVNQVMPGMFGGGMGQLALNQLLVVMDGIGDPPFWRRFWTRNINKVLDATYIVPIRIGNASLRLPRPRPRSEQIFFVGATNVPIEVLDPALTRPGRMGRHIWFRTPTQQDRQDIFDLYLAKVTHEPDLGTTKRRAELARITNGYSPAMIEQVCSMALTIAHHEGRPQFGWGDIVEAMTTVESGTAIGIDYVPEETRAVAIHEAGHAAAAHIYRSGLESTRLSIRRRGGSLGHHQAQEKEERFSKWRSEEMGALVHTLGAMAAERVFYGENSTGVAGDVQSATVRAALMVGTRAMAPERLELNGRFRSDEQRDEERARIAKRFEAIGIEILNRTGGDPFHHDPIQGVLADRDKRSMAAQLLGQAYVIAHNLIDANREAVEKIADAVIEQREIYGDDLVELLESVGLQKPEIDYADEAAWPRL